MKNLADKKIVITGATGGIGSELARLLAKENANLILLSSGLENLQKLQHEIQDLGGKSNYIQADLSTSQGIKDAAAILSEIDDIYAIINLAGISYFGSFGMQKFEEVEKVYNVNLLATTVLTQAVLPEMIKNHSGRIINIGSTFGSIAFGFFATYSASKAAVRSFSEALRRELQDSGVSVSYVAPRVVKTKFNAGKVDEFNVKTKANVDEPQKIAQNILDVLKTKKSYAYLGFPESLFVRLNYLLPGLVDNALKKQMTIAREIFLNQK